MALFTAAWFMVKTKIPAVGRFLMVSFQLIVIAKGLVKMARQ
jgi:hypothetical protein